MNRRSGDRFVMERLERRSLQVQTVAERARHLDARRVLQPCKGKLAVLCKMYGKCRIVILSKVAASFSICSLIDALNGG